MKSSGRVPNLIYNIWRYGILTYLQVFKVQLINVEEDMRSEEENFNYVEMEFNSSFGIKVLTLPSTYGGALRSVMLRKKGMNSHATCDVK